MEAEAKNEIQEFLADVSPEFLGYPKNGNWNACKPDISDCETTISGRSPMVERSDSFPIELSYDFNNDAYKVVLFVDATNLPAKIISSLNEWFKTNVG